VYFDDKKVIKVDMISEEEFSRQSAARAESKRRQASISESHSAFVSKLKAVRFLNTDILSSRKDIVAWKSAFLSESKRKTIAYAEWVVGPAGNIAISIQFIQADDMRTIRQEACIELLDDSDRVLGVIGQSRSYPSRPGRDDRLSFMYWDVEQGRNSTMPKVSRMPDGTYTPAFMDYVNSIRFLRLESTDSTIAYPLLKLVSR